MEHVDRYDSNVFVELQGRVVLVDELFSFCFDGDLTNDDLSKRHHSVKVSATGNLDILYPFARSIIGGRDSEVLLNVDDRYREGLLQLGMKSEYVEFSLGNHFRSPFKILDKLNKVGWRLDSLLLDWISKLPNSKAFNPNGILFPNSGIKIEKGYSSLRNDDGLKIYNLEQSYNGQRENVIEFLDVIDRAAGLK